MAGHQFFGIPDSVFIAAANVTVVLTAVIVATYYLSMFNRGILRNETERAMGIGIIGVALSWVIHRLYWPVQLYLEQYDITQYAATILYEYSLVTVAPLLLVSVFHGWHLSAILKYLFGPRWPLKWGLVVLSVFGVLAWLTA